MTPDNPYAQLNVAVLKHREAAAVQRCHTIPHVGSYSVGQHCHDALSLLFILHPKPSPKLIRALHFHDVAERWVGDMPTLAKRIDVLGKALDIVETKVLAELGHTYGLSKDEQRWLHAIDAVEFMLWCMDQLAMGNRHVEPNFNQVKDSLTKMELPEQVKAFLSASRWGRTGP